MKDEEVHKRATDMRKIAARPGGIEAFKKLAAEIGWDRAAQKAREEQEKRAAREFARRRRIFQDDELSIEFKIFMTLVCVGGSYRSSLRGVQTVLDLALTLAAEGFAVFPVVPGTKRPAIPKWQERASADPAAVAALWAECPQGVPAIHPGACTPPMMVVDIDTKGQHNGYEWYYTSELPPTLEVTTPSGGLHAYFRADGIGNSAGRVGPGVDIRGLAGYVLGTRSPRVHQRSAGRCRCPSVAHSPDSTKGSHL